MTTSEKSIRPTGSESGSQGTRDGLEVWSEATRIRHGELFSVYIENHGRTPVSFSVIGRDPYDKIRFVGQRGRVRLEPGEQVAIELRIWAKDRFLIGPPRRRPFELLVSVSGEIPYRLPGRLETHSYLPIWAFIIFLLALVVILVVATKIFGSSNDDLSPVSQPATTRLADGSDGELAQDDHTDAHNPDLSLDASENEESSDSFTDSIDLEMNSQERKPAQGWVGWAYVPYLETGLEQMSDDFEKMRNGGANVVYIGHSQPGELDAPMYSGLTFSLYYAIQNHAPLEARALDVLRVVKQAVQAASDEGLDVVLPIGYQFQMGQEWNEINEEHLRRSPDGSLMIHGDSGAIASPYSLQFQKDILEYYNWVNDELVKPFPGIVALNLCDEPMGADYSRWAQDTFMKQEGIDFWGSDAAYQRGKFLSLERADAVARLSEFWLEINPRVWVMMANQVDRTSPWFPDIEAIFANAPENFIFSANALYHDGLQEDPFADVFLLANLTRTLGWYSAVYDRPLMLWTAANNLGLRGNTFGLKEADENFQIIINESRRNGGNLAMVLAWGFNIQDQGIFHSGGSVLGFEPENMFTKLSDQFATHAPSLGYSGTESPSQVLLLSKQTLYETIGQQNPEYKSPAIVDLVPYGDRLGQENAVVLTSGKAADQALEEGAIEILILP